MTLDASKICFGLAEDLDQQSLSIFLQLAGKKEFADHFSGQLTGDEITAFVDHFMGLLRKHLSEDEYHRLFLGDHTHHHRTE